MTDKLLIGEIKGAHGVKGLVRIAVYVDNVELFNAIGTHTITMKNKHKGEIWLAAIEGIADKNAADALKGTQFHCDRSALPELSAEEIYFADLVGKICIDEDRTEIGTVQSTHNFGAGDLLEVTPPNGGTSFFISYDDNTILEVGDSIKVSIPEII